MNPFFLFAERGGLEEDDLGEEPEEDWAAQPGALDGKTHLPPGHEPLWRHGKIDTSSEALIRFLCLLCLFYEEKKTAVDYLSILGILCHKTRHCSTIIPENKVAVKSTYQIYILNFVCRLMKSSGRSWTATREQLSARAGGPCSWSPTSWRPPVLWTGGKRATSLLSRTR